MKKKFLKIGRRYRMRDGNVVWLADVMFGRPRSALIRRRVTRYICKDVETLERSEVRASFMFVEEVA